LQKELIERNKEFANKIEMLSVKVEEKDGKIGSLTQLNKVLEQKKKELETKNNEQQQTISNQEEKIKEQDTLITSLTDTNKDIDETVKKDNESLRAQNTELKSKFSKLNNESDTKIRELKSQLEEKQAEFTQAEEKMLNLEKNLESVQQQLEQKITDLTNQLKDSISKLNAAEKNKKDLEDEVKELKEQAKKKNTEVENLKQQLEKEKDELKDSSSKLNATETEKKELEGEVKELKEQVQALEESKEWESAGIDDSLRQTHLNLIEMLKKELAKKEKQIEQLQEKQKQVEDQSKADIKKLQGEKENMEEQLRIMQQQLLNNQEQQKLKEKSNNVDTKLEGIDEKTKAQAKTKEVDTVSTVSIAKSTASKILKSSKNFFVNKNLKDFLSDQNAKLKKSFPEFEGKHFCHNVLEKTIQSLVYQNDYKFKSDKLLELLETNLKNLAREIIETKFNKVVEEFAKDFVKKHDLKQVIFVEKCAKKLHLNEEDSKAIINSFTEFFDQKNVSNNASVKKFVAQKLTEAEMKCFSDKVQQLASSIRDKFLSPDQRMCNKTQGRVNEYQLTDKAKKEYTPNSSMRHTTSSNIQGLAR